MSTDTYSDVNTGTSVGRRCSVPLAVKHGIAAVLVAALSCADSGALAAESASERPSTTIRQMAPADLASRFLVDNPPLTLTIGDKPVPLSFRPRRASEFEARTGDLVITLAFRAEPDHRALQWVVTLMNAGRVPMEGITLVPVFLELDVDPEVHFPRVRHLSGSNHYDATFPPRAFRLAEERFMTHDHAKGVRIESSALGSTYDHSSVLQFSIGPYGNQSGLFISFEWSSRWHLEARWARPSWTGEPRPRFVIEGNVGLTKLRLEPGETLPLPVVHLGFWEGADWTSGDNAVRRYVREVVGARLNGQPPRPPVSYDHWFGIHHTFDVEDLKRQATRAAALGVEYFCLDAAWYPVAKSFADGLGDWFPDPKKFPNGIEELSEHVRRLGMGFGLWHIIERAVPESKFAREHPDLYHRGMYLRLDMPAGRALAIRTIRRWITDWKLTWIRWELSDPQAWAYELDPSGKLAYSHMNGLYEVIDTIRREHPNVYIEGVAGGGTRMDWGMARRTHGTWLSDHTAHPDVTRYMQMTTSRFWPAHFLNMAVRVHRNTGDLEATPHRLLSRMVGTLSFNGDIAQWSPEAVRLARSYVDTYKSIRDRLNGPVYFPLPPPLSDRDWDVAVFGDTEPGQLMFAFRIEGPETVDLTLPPGEWVQIAGDPTPTPAAVAEGLRLRLGRNRAALWERRR